MIPYVESIYTCLITCMATLQRGWAFTAKTKFNMIPLFIGWDGMFLAFIRSEVFNNHITFTPSIVTQ